MRSSADLFAMAQDLRKGNLTAARLEEIATALDGCARQVGTVDPLRGEIEAMHDRELVTEAHAHAEDGFPPAPRC